MSIGDKLRMWMEERDWTQAKLARESKVDPSHISRLLSGERTGRALQVETARKLAQALDVDMSEFYIEPEKELVVAASDGEADLLGWFSQLNLGDAEVLIGDASTPIEENDCIICNYDGNIEKGYYVREKGQEIIDCLTQRFLLAECTVIAVIKIR